MLQRRTEMVLRAMAAALFFFLCLVSVAFASSEEADAAPVYEYSITITPPSGWYLDSADVKITIRDLTGEGWQSAELIHSGSSTPINGSTAVIAISQNDAYTVRVTDPNGETHEASQTIECFDTTAPSVTAGIRDKVLHAEASDSQSGVRGILVDGNLYTTLRDGALDLRLEDYADAGKTLSVVAVDNVGNRSAQTAIDNPYYSSATPAPAAANSPVIIYTGSVEDSNSSTTASATATPTPVVSNSAGTASTGAAVSSTSTTTPVSTTVTHAVQDTTADEPEETAEPEAEEITITPGKGFSQNGNAVTRDLLYDEYTNKQFITVQTRNGNTMYLVIDYDKVSDADEELYQTYFLNPVDEADLLALLDDDAISALSSSDDADTPVVCTCTNKCSIGHIDTTCPVCRTDVSKCTGVETVTPTPEPTTEPEETEPEAETSGGMGGGIVAVLLILGLIGGGVFYFLKNKKSKPRTAGSTDFDDYDFGVGEDEDDEELEIPEDVEDSIE